MVSRTYKGCVYRATLLLGTNKGFAYIGKTLAGMKARRSVHYCHARRGLKTPFAHALNAYDERAFLWEELFCSDDDAMLKAVEIEQIALHRASGITLYNISAGGDGYSGAKWTAERREQHQRCWAEKRKAGYKMSPESRARISEAAKKRPPTVMSLEGAARVSAAKKAYWSTISADDPRKLRLAKIASLGAAARSAKRQAKT